MGKTWFLLSMTSLNYIMTNNIGRAQNKCLVSILTEDFRQEMDNFFKLNKIALLLVRKVSEREETSKVLTINFYSLLIVFIVTMFPSVWGPF